MDGGFPEFNLACGFNFGYELALLRRRLDPCRWESYPIGSESGAAIIGAFGTRRRRLARPASGWNTLVKEPLNDS
jgi:hypothetical protein